MTRTLRCPTARKAVLSSLRCELPSDWIAFGDVCHSANLLQSTKHETRHARGESDLSMTCIKFGANRLLRFSTIVSISRGVQQNVLSLRLPVTQVTEA